jgi:hypothetical protein
LFLEWKTGEPMAAHQYRAMRKRTRGEACWEAAFLALAAAYSLVFWGLQACELWRVLQS